MPQYSLLLDQLKSADSFSFLYHVCGLSTGSFLKMQTTSYSYSTTRKFMKRLWKHGSYNNNRSLNLRSIHNAGMALTFFVSHTVKMFQLFKDLFQSRRQLKSCYLAKNPYSQYKNTYDCLFLHLWEVHFQDLLIGSWFK